MANSPVQPDRGRTKDVAQRIISDVATAAHAALCYIGDRLGIFKAMKDAGELSVAQLARQTGLVERYLREWLGSMVAAQYVQYSPERQTYLLSPEYAAALADEGSPFFVASYFQMVQALSSVAPKVAEAFRSGGGVPQSEYPASVFEASERNSLPRYKFKLIPRWLPAMPQVVRKLQAGGIAADVGCGAGQAAIIMAKAFPNSRVFGYDQYAPVVERARKNAVAQGVGDRVVFEVADVCELPARRFDLITAFDVIHDMVDPVAVLKAIRMALASEGSFLMQEINVSPNLEENIKPLGRMVYSVSTLYCMTTSLACGGAGIGAAMGEPKARELARQAGFSSFIRLPVQDDFAVLYELRP